MFGIEYTPSKDKEQPETLELYGQHFQLRKKKHWFSAIPVVCLWTTTSAVIAVTLIVFVDGLILNVIYLPPNQECPEGGDMDCYSTFGSNSYFYCNSSGISIPTSLGSVTCYRWFKKGLSTLEILEQIGLCAGLIQVFNWIVNLYVRLLLYSYAFPREMAHHYARPWLATICTLVSLIGPIVTIGILAGTKVGVTGLTMAFGGCTLFIVIAMLVLIWTWRRNKRLVLEEVAEISRNTAMPKSMEMVVLDVERQ